MIDRSVIEDVRSRHPIVETVQGYVALRHEGRLWRGCCPFHADSDPSLAVYPAVHPPAEYPQEGRYYCFGCGEGGDVIDFVMEMEHLSFRETVSRLGGSRRPPALTSSGVTGSGVTPRRPVGKLLRQPGQPEQPVGQQVGREAVREHEADRLTPADRQILQVAAACYHSALLGNQTALSYVLARAIPMHVIRQWQVGYANGKRLGLYLMLHRQNLRRALALGLFCHGERLAGRIVFPEIRRDGVYYLSGRATLPGQEPKYLGLPLPKALYGVQALGKSKLAFLTEGYFDWLTLLSWGYPALCLGGTRLKSQQVALLSGLERIYLALDSDQAGQEGAAKIQEALGERAVILRLPPGVKDVNELATSCQDGRDTFGRLVVKAT
jgi:DNA primase